MKLLVAIPHFFGTSRVKRYGSLSGRRGPRARALTRCISALHELFAGEQCFGDFTRPTWKEANEAIAGTVDVCVCTTQGSHVLADVSLPKDWYREVVCNCPPPLLGFECHALLREQLGNYDYYCYLEDDLVLHDPWLFVKLRRFTEAAGVHALLQPNRYEIPLDTRPRKIYVDGDIPAALTAPFQDISQQPEVTFDCLNVTVTCRRTSLPHSGCFFLNGEQLEYWSQQEWFLDRNTSFLNPLDSAATLGIMRTFRVYKPVAAVASFLEIEHCGERLTRMIEDRYRRATRQEETPEPRFPSIIFHRTAPARPDAEEPLQPSDVPIQSLWIGPKLSTMERLSIASFLALGHPVHVYTYDELERVPPGTVLQGANAILPESEVFVQQNGIAKGSYAPFSDLFRYKLLLEKGGWWVDLDVVALRPFQFDRQYVFGYERPAVVGNAVLRAPAGCELLQRCYQEADRLRGGAEWTETGPRLLTRTVAELGLSWATEPRVAFQPVHARRIQRFVKPGGTLSRRTYAAHLVRHVWRWSKLDPDGRFPPDCVYEKLKQRYRHVCDL